MSVLVSGERYCGDWWFLKSSGPRGLSKQGKGLSEIKGVVSRWVSDFVFFPGVGERREGAGVDSKVAVGKRERG